MNSTEKMKKCDVTNEDLFFTLCLSRLFFDLPQ